MDRRDQVEFQYKCPRCGLEDHYSAWELYKNKDKMCPYGCSGVGMFLKEIVEGR